MAPSETGLGGGCLRSSGSSVRHPSPHQPTRRPFPLRLRLHPRPFASCRVSVAHFCANKRPSSANTLYLSAILDGSYHCRSRPDLTGALANRILRVALMLLQTHWQFLNNKRQEEHATFPGGAAHWRCSLGPRSSGVGARPSGHNRQTDGLPQTIQPISGYRESSPSGSGR